MRVVTVVGASLAGLSAARALRAEGFDGRITLVGDEPHRPYDRPPLSKEFLQGSVARDELELSTPADDTLDLDWRLGSAATSLDTTGRRILLRDGAELVTDGVVITTGARARPLTHAAELPGVHTLRTVEDCLALRAALRAGGSLVVIGGGFIGAEVASTARSLGAEVTVVEAAPVPLSGPLGPEMGAACAALHADHGVTLLCDSPVSDLVGEKQVRAVRLADGRELPTDAVVVGVGAQPNTEWLQGSTVRLGDGVLTDTAGATNVPQVVAAGDCTAPYSPELGRHVRTEHWTHALKQPAVAVRTLLTGSSETEGPVASPSAILPYFWSEQYGSHIQFAGTRQNTDTVRIVTGSCQERSFLAVYERDGQPTAVLGINQPKLFTRWRRQLANGG